MSSRFGTFDSAKMGHNMMWEQPFNSIENQPYLQKIKAKNQVKPKLSQKQTISQESKENQQTTNLEDLWNSIEQKEPVNSVKVQIMNIADQPETLTSQQYQLIFGKATDTKKESPQEKLELQAEDLGDLWEQINESQPEKIQVKQTSIPEVLNLQNKQCEDETFDFQEKQSSSVGKTRLILGKNFQVYDMASFMINCYETSTYGYFGFHQKKKGKYQLYDIRGGKTFLSCCEEKYEELVETKIGKKIAFQTDYCLKFRLNSGELVATMWKKSITNGIFFNLRLYNLYEKKYDDCLALIEIADGYIGQFCYCNTVAHLSQKYSKQPGPFTMKLALKNGYLISHMGVTGIKSAPFNCRLENPGDSFVFLMGMIDKPNEKFLVRVGEGMSPLVAFAISIGRKRYIDSFKE